MKATFNTVLMMSPLKISEADSQGKTYLRLPISLIPKLSLK